MIYVLTVCYNRSEITGAFLKQLSKQTYQDFQVLLVDDKSTDDTVANAKSCLDSNQLEIINGTGSLYWGGGLHLGYEILSNKLLKDEDLVIICNDDIEFDSDFLEMADNVWNQKSNVLIHATQTDIGNPERIAYGFKLHWKVFGFETERTNKDINTLDTRTLLIKAKEFIELGGFYPRLLPHYASDWEFTHRAFRKGFNLSVSKNLIIRTNIQEKVNKFDLTNQPISWKNFKFQYLNRQSPFDLISLFWFAFLSAPLHLKATNCIGILLRGSIMGSYALSISLLRLIGMK